MRALVHSGKTHHSSPRFAPSGMPKKAGVGSSEDEAAPPLPLKGFMVDVEPDCCWCC